MRAENVQLSAASKNVFFMKPELTRVVQEALCTLPAGLKIAKTASHSNYMHAVGVKHYL
jgi:hypothetical protein